MRELRRHVEHLEDLAGASPGRQEPWPVEDQLAAVLDRLDFHMTFGTVAPCTDRELNLISGTFPEGVPDEVREYAGRVDPRRQEERDRREYERRHDFRPWRERVRQAEEEHRAYAERSRQGDRELLESNRASVGLPPLTPEQIERWGLEGTTWGG